MNPLALLAKIPARLYEYLALIAFIFVVGWWFVLYQRDIGKREILDEIAKQREETQGKINKQAARDSAAADPQFKVFDDARKRYENPFPHPADDVYADPDFVRGVNALHKTSR